MTKNNNKGRIFNMKTGRILTSDADIEAVLRAAKTIAVLGLSPKPERDSYQVADYLKKNGFRILPVRPAQTEILGEKAFDSLNDVNEKVDVVDVFRRSDQVMEHAREALALKPSAFWMQEGVENPEAARLLTAHGIDVVMNKCIKVEYERLVKNRAL
jgi:hypothetical protein